MPDNNVSTPESADLDSGSRRPPRGGGRWGWASKMLDTVAHLAGDRNTTTPRFIIAMLTIVTVTGLFMLGTIGAAVLVLVHVGVL